MIGLCSWLSTRRHSGVGLASGSTFAPTVASRSAATSDVIPASAVWSNAAAAEPVGREASVAVVVAMTDPCRSFSTVSVVSQE
jgi:hypothetical protein